MQKCLRHLYGVELLGSYLVMTAISIDCTVHIFELKKQKTTTYKRLVKFVRRKLHNIRPQIFINPQG